MRPWRDRGMHRSRVGDRFGSKAAVWTRRACLLHPEKRKFAGEISESAWGREATFDKGAPERHPAYP
jgi:hypothetical protein